ncbi:ComEC/Rec2 family competence protein [Ascidiimonas aurantiaca]|uniref:ComEC/Rec2 family competence protein n=1 Tax=Ascidiimonas aurantiaca TaxID=1685432 RepID=UPI0030EFA23A
MGIFYGYYTNPTPQGLFPVVAACFLLLFVFRKIANRYPRQTALFSIVAFTAFFLTGALSISLKNTLNSSFHYSKIDQGNRANLLVRIESTLRPSARYYRYKVQILQLDSLKAEGQLLMNLLKDSIANVPVSGDLYRVGTRLLAVPPPVNPGQFDYAGYLRKQQIFHQVYVNPDAMVKTGHARSLLSVAEGIRRKIQQSLQDAGFTGNTKAVISALLLGERTFISRDLYENYAAAGAIHILAVSGLHVGIVLLMLNYALTPLLLLKNGQMYRLLITLVLLWFFALIAGLSPSVVRAVTMFSFVAFAMNRKKLTNTANILTVSMFFLLLINPFFLFDVGFQLSYAAVFSILGIQPLIVKVWKPKIRFIKYFWQLLTVTIAAQLGLLPLSLYYFHQFPGLFFVSNLLIVPVLGVVLSIGILVIILSVSNAMPYWLTQAYSGLIQYINYVVEWIAGKESFLFRNIPFSELDLVVSYCLLISVWMFFKKPSKLRSAISIAGIVSFVAVFIYQEHTHAKYNQVVIFHQSRQSVIVFHHKKHLSIYRPNTINSRANQRLVQGYQTLYRIKTTDTILTHSFKDKIAIIDSSAHITAIHRAPVMVLRYSPRLNLQRLIQRYRPKIIIADGSNYPGFKKRWQATCREENVVFHDTYEEGAFILELEKY